METFLQVINMIALSYKMSFIADRPPEECMIYLWELHNKIMTDGKSAGRMLVESWRASMN